MEQTNKVIIVPNSRPIIIDAGWNSKKSMLSKRLNEDDPTHESHTFGGYLFYHARKHHKIETGCSCRHHHTTDNISNTKTASITGFVAGLMPCLTAIAPLIISGVHDGFNSTLLHILIYVSGMTLALCAFTGVLLLMKFFFKGK